MPKRFNIHDHKPLIGQPIPDLPRSVVTPIPAHIVASMDQLSNSDLIGIGLRNGIDPRELCGEETCAFHTTGPEKGLWVELPGNRIMNHKLQLGISVVWCRGCLTWMRLK